MHGATTPAGPQVEVAFEELTKDVKHQLAAEDQQRLEAHMSQVLEAVDLDKYLAGGLNTPTACKHSTLSGRLVHAHCMLGTVGWQLLQAHLVITMRGHAGAELKDAVRPGQQLPEKLTEALKRAKKSEREREDPVAGVQ